MRRYFLQLSYQGTHYHGWQAQANALTVQGILQERLEQLLQRPVVICGSSRTDTGVHAHQQWAHVDLSATLDIAKLHRQINRILPHDIALLGIYPVACKAHARFDALARTYEYAIIRTKNPFLRQTYYLLHAKLDMPAMNKAAAVLCHKTDFTSFSKKGSGVNHYQCSISSAQWIAIADDQLVFSIQANRFLRGMVRSIVSNLIQVGLGKVSVGAFAAFIDAKDRSSGASLVPACGLTLTKITYPSHVFIN